MTDQPRKIIQITTASFPPSRYMEWSQSTIALCDDGSLWELVQSRECKKGKWRLLPDIPQEEELEDD